MDTPPEDMGPADLAPNTVPPAAETAEDAARGTRDWMYSAIPAEAKERFLEAATRAREGGASVDEAWDAATRAAAEAYDDEPEPGLM